MYVGTAIIYSTFSFYWYIHGVQNDKSLQEFKHVRTLLQVPAVMVTILNIRLYYRLRTFLTASLYCIMVSSLSPSFFNLVTESLYSCTPLLPSSCSRISSPSPSPATFMRASTSKIFLWDGLSSQLYSSMSATVFSASQASVF